MQETPKKRMSRMKRTRRLLAGALTAGVCFQTVQCAVDPNQLGTELFGTIITLFVTDYFNNLFGVSPTGF